MSALSALLDLALPAQCPACHQQPGAALCPQCCDQLQLIEDPCPRCAAACMNQHCPRCHDRGLRGIRRVFIDYYYTGALRTLILQAKVKARRAAIKSLCDCLPVASAAAWQADAITVIPPSRGRRFGPHLATALARHLAQELELPLLGLLRHRHLPAAQHELPESLRNRNTTELFTVKHTADTAPKLLLVDDLMTSGATLEAAAATLRKHGCRQIAAVCAARSTAGMDEEWSG